MYWQSTLKSTNLQKWHPLIENAIATRQNVKSNENAQAQAK